MHCHTRLTAVASAIALLCSVPAAYAGQTTVSSGQKLTLNNSVDHSTEVVNMTGGSLNVLPGVVLGGSSANIFSIKASGGTLSVSDGTLIPGSITLDGHTTATIGIDSGSDLPTVVHGGIDGQGDSIIHLDKASLLGRSDYESGAAILSGNSQLTSTRNTVFSAEDGIDLGDNSSATVDGSSIRGSRIGVYLYDSAAANLKDINLSSEATGLYLSDNTVTNISGATLTVSNNRSQVDTDIDVIDDFTATGIFVDGTPGLSKGTPHLSMSDSTLSVNSPGASAGLLFLEDSAPISADIKNSSIDSRKYGVVFEHTTPSVPGESTAPANVNFSNVSLKSDDNALLSVRAGSKANLLVQNGSRFVAGNHTALDVESGGSADITVNDSDVTGDVVNQGGTANVTLGNNGHWTGAFTHLSSLTAQAGSQAVLTASSDVTGDVINAGTIRFADGQPGHLLTVGGNYTGNNGALLFNSALAGDGSPTDKMVVKGNATGTTNVSVTNAGGTGAQTIDGIQIIEVDGTSAAGAFQQQGRIVAGAYDYTLNEHGNNWYLDSRLSQVTPPPGPPVPPVPPEPVIHVIRPEAGAYMANQAASSMFLTTLHDRAGENRYMNVLDGNGNGDATSLWLRQVGSHTAFRDGSGQLRTTGNTYVAQLGGDLTQWSSDDLDRFHLGVMAGYGNNHNNTRSTVSGHSAKGSSTGYSVGMYGTWYQNDLDNTGAYVDGQLLYSGFNNQVSGEGIHAEKYHSKGLTASLETGYTLAMGQSDSPDNPTRYFIEPQAQVTWMGVKADNLTESNGTRVSSQGNNNVRTRLGVRAFMQGHNGIDNGKDRTFQPFVEVNWLHNTKRNGVVMNGVALEQAGAVNIGEVKLGVEGQLSKNTQLWGNVAQDIGGKGYSDTTAMLGVKYAF